MAFWRIGLVIDRLDPLKGGAEAYLVRLARFLAGRGHEPHFLACHFAPGVDGGQTHAVRLPPLPRALRDIAFDRGAARLAVRLGLDVTLGVRHTPSTAVFQPHGGVYSCAARAQSRSAGWRRPLHAQVRALNPKHLALLHLEALQRRRGGRVRHVALSERVRADMCRVYRLDEADAPVLLYNGVDCRRFAPDPGGDDRARIRARHGIDPAAFVVLFMAHNFRLKGLGHLIAAAAGLQRRPDPRLRVLVVGRGRTAGYVRRARALGLGQTFVFAGDTAAPEGYYRAADVLAHPTYYDPCSSVCLEALACGLPVVTTAANGVGELIAAAGGGVVLADAADEGGLRAALAGLRRDPGRRARLAAEARRLAEAHPEDRAFAGLESVLAAAAQGGG
ncbi:MAG: glycosyltransferase family 4 protein [Planctomycetes bacterium]|nr:glycosyltransferase family 4 protein [Planctomycetota bacterium]